MVKTQTSTTTSASSSERLIESATQVLRRHLPARWSVAWEHWPTQPTETWQPDAIITVKALEDGPSTRLIVEHKTSLTPRAAGNAALRLKKWLRNEPTATGVVIAPWGSRRTRDVLREAGIGFIDPTGNIELVSNEPALVVRVDGASDNPAAGPPTLPSLRGPRAWALLKTLIDVKPPYGVRELAAAVDADPGYTSRVLQALEDERLITRKKRGPIMDVDWPGLLVELTSKYAVLEANMASTWIARGAVRSLPDELAGAQIQTSWAITGSLGASLLAPVAAPAMAMIYADNEAELADQLKLLPADSGANVVLIHPYDSAALSRTWTADVGRFVSVAQLAADCLSGPGRMPAEGQALVEWMTANEDRWRARSFDEAPNPMARS